MELYGVRGWLLLLCLLLTVIDPVVVLANLFAQTEGAREIYNKQPEMFKVFVVTGVLGIALAVFSMYSGLSLWKIAPNAVRTARYYLVAEAAFSFVPFFLPAVFGVPLSSPEGIQNLYIFNALATTAYASAWYAYLSRSRRVRATYFGDDGNKTE
jgi:hypothetical protein